ncbi:MAG: hypothetical protein RLZZ399_1146 [Verrucomicrobiota bacterium]
MRGVVGNSGLELLDHAGAVAVALGGDPEAVEEGEPDVGERGVLGEDKVLPEFEVGAAAGEKGGAIIEVMDAADVAAVGEGDVVEERGAIGFPGGLEFVEKSGEEFALGGVPFLGGLHALARAVVAHVMRADLEVEALEERAHGLAVGEHARRIGLQRSDDEIVHDADLLLAREAWFGFGHGR